MTNENLRNKIHEANIEVHDIEAKYYDIIHQEIFNKREQKRVMYILNRLDKLIDNNHKKALDLGAGTGNLTGKLLHMGYNVTAVDISKEMCRFLEKKYKKFLINKNLNILNSKIEDIEFNKEEFDLITCYSVLHHLPDYVNVIRKLSFFLKKGGIIYLDHEASPFVWNESKGGLTIKQIYKRTNYLIKKTIRIISSIQINIPSNLYSMSDYWTKKTHHLNHDRIKKIFEEEGYDFYKRENYYLYQTILFNPIFYIYKNLYEPDTSLWIAKK